jgi:hypothetical protein
MLLCYGRAEHPKTAYPLPLRYPDGRLTEAQLKVRAMLVKANAQSRKGGGEMKRILLAIAFAAGLMGSARAQATPGETRDAIAALTAYAATEGETPEGFCARINMDEDRLLAVAIAVHRTGGTYTKTIRSMENLARIQQGLAPLPND